MAKKAYIGVGGKARKVKKIYLGNSTVARKVKKAYIGIGGVARPCWTGGELAYYGETTPLPEKRSEGAAASNSKYALFAGGNNGPYTSNKSNNVYAYDVGLTQTTAPTLQRGKVYISAARAGENVIFLGDGRKEIDAYDSNLTHTSSSNDQEENRNRPGAASTGGHAIFLGSTNGTNKVSAYSSSLTFIALPDLDWEETEKAGTNLAEFAVFVGGGGSSGDIAFVYDNSLTRVASLWSPGDPLLGSVGTSVGDYAVFTGCYILNSAFTITVDKSLTLRELNVGYIGRSGAATNLEGYAIFKFDNKEFVYDENLTMTMRTDTKANRTEMQAASIGDYAIFAGGHDGSNNKDNVYVYQV